VVRYFLTGGTGYIGAEIARQLVAGGHQVTALVRDQRRALELIRLGADCIPGDVGDVAALRRGMQNADGVFHVAGWYRIGSRDMRAAWATNVDGTRNVLEAMRDLEIPRGVYTSTLAVFSDTHGRVVDEDYSYVGPWLSVYDETKWRAHHEVAQPMIERGLPLVIVQPGAVYGRDDPSPLGPALRAAAAGRSPVVPGGSAYCWGHVEDTARGHLQAMERGDPGRTYIIAGPPHSLAEAFTLAAQVTGAAPPRIVLPPAPMRLMASVLGALERLPRWPALPPALTAEYSRVAAGVTYLGSNARARSELGFNPRSLVDGLRDVFGRS
jgi:nucleoside-diphosphate-sugar epimerase